MPPRRRKRKRFRRRRATRAPRIKTVGGVANTMYVKLKYAATPTALSTSTGLSQQTYAINNIFDPNTTGVGYQPRNHDEWSLMYKKYMVLGCRIVVRAYNEGSKSALVMFEADYDSIPTGTVGAHERESPKVDFRIIGPDLGNRAMLTYSKYINVRKMAGGVVGDKSYGWASFGASPADVLYFHINQQTIDASTSITVRYVVDLIYDVRLSEPLIATES